MKKSTSTNEKDALSDDDARSLAYFAVGVGSEGSIGGRDVSNHLSFAGNDKGGKLNPIGNSGYSLGTLQTDLGAHPEVAQHLVSSYQAWAKTNHPDWLLDNKQQQQTVADLGRNGNAIRADNGWALDATVKSHLDEFMKSSAGKTFVHERDERQVNLLTRPDSVFTKLQATALYQNSSREDQARLATVALKVENQTGGEGVVWKHEKHRKPHKVVDGLIESIDKGEIKSIGDIDPWLNKHPKYVRDGVAHALQGTETYLRLEHANPNNDLHRAWLNVKANATTDPGKLDPNSTLGRDYATVKEQFLHPHGHRQDRHPDTIELQTKLGQLGYLVEKDGNPSKADGSFGPHTREAVKTFQREHHLKADGVPGPNTLKAIEATLKEQEREAPTRDEPTTRGHKAVSQITDTDHPAHPLLEQAKGKLAEIDAKLGRKPDQMTENAAAAIAVAAAHKGLTRIDHLELNDKGDKFIAAQGQLGTAQSKVIDVPTATAVNTTVAQSSQAFSDAQQTHKAPQPTPPATQQAEPAFSR